MSLYSKIYILKNFQDEYPHSKRTVEVFHPSSCFPVFFFIFGLWLIWISIGGETFSHSLGEDKQRKFKNKITFSIDVFSGKCEKFSKDISTGGIFLIEYKTARFSIIHPVPQEYWNWCIHHTPQFDIII